MDFLSNSIMERQYNDTRGTECKQAVDIIHRSCSDKKV